MRSILANYVYEWAQRQRKPDLTLQPDRNTTRPPKIDVKPNHANGKQNKRNDCRMLGPSNVRSIIDSVYLNAQIIHKIKHFTYCTENKKKKKRHHMHRNKYFTAISEAVDAIILLSFLNGLFPLLFVQSTVCICPKLENCSALSQCSNV